MLLERSTFSNANDGLSTEGNFSITKSNEETTYNNENSLDSINYHLDESTGFRGKRIQHAADVEELIRALGGLNLERDYWLQTAARIQSPSPAERYEATKQFRMMLSVSGDIPIQAVIDTGIVPQLVEFISEDRDAALQFEAAWALTNIASGTGAQTEVIRKCCLQSSVDIQQLLRVNSIEPVAS